MIIPFIEGNDLFKLVSLKLERTLLPTQMTNVNNLTFVIPVDKIYTSLQKTFVATFWRVMSN